MTNRKLEKKWAALTGIGVVAMLTLLLTLSGRAEVAARQMRGMGDDSAVRGELTSDYAHFSDAVRHKDTSALAAFLRDKTTGDLQVKGPNGLPQKFVDMTVPESQMRGLDLPLTRELMLKDLPAARQMSTSYVVENADIRLDKLVVFGDTALVLTTGTEVGSNNDLEARLDNTHQAHWSSVRYRDCETWIKTPKGWKLREIYALAYVLDHWRRHTPSEKYSNPDIGF